MREGMREGNLTEFSFARSGGMLKKEIERTRLEFPRTIVKMCNGIGGSE